MFDTCTTCIPLSPTLFGLSAALHRRCTNGQGLLVVFAVSHSLMCGSLTLEGMCHCAGLGTWVLHRNLRGTGSSRRLHLQEACYTISGL